MPRIRTIKPEFWTDGDVVELSPFARLLFIGSWNFAICDRGHVADDPKRLKMQILPADAVDPVALLDELLTAGRLDRIALPDGRSVLHIRRFTDHQKIEKRWNPRCYACDSLGLNDSPATSPNLSEPRASLADLSDSPATSAQEGKGRERNKEPSSSEIADAIPDKEPVREDVTRICQHLQAKIVENGSKRPNITQAWRRECRLLIDRDGKTEQQIMNAIDWCQTDSFWKTNILSMPKLREKYDQIRLKAIEQQRKDAPAPQRSYEAPPPPDEADLDWDEIGEAS